MQSIEAAGYRCEIDETHETFTAKSTGHPYMEGHHALSMKYQNKFSKVWMFMQILFVYVRFAIDYYIMA